MRTHVAEFYLQGKTALTRSCSFLISHPTVLNYQKNSKAQTSSAEKHQS